MTQPHLLIIFEICLEFYPAQGPSRGLQEEDEALVEDRGRSDAFDFALTIPWFASLSSEIPCVLV